MKVVARTDKGKVRVHNEDYYFIPDDRSPLDNVLIVADGVGGHNAGDVASFIAVRTIVDYMIQHKSEPLMPDVMLKSALQAANNRLLELARAFKQYEGMGTTLTMAWLLGEEAFIAHIGDSRVYFIDHSSIHQVTEDHSLVQQMINNGSITKDEAVNHPQRNVITRALGSSLDVEADILKLNFHSGNMLLLCTDGLTNQLNDEEIFEICNSDHNLEHKVERLIRMANDKGGFDNITVILSQN